MEDFSSKEEKFEQWRYKSAIPHDYWVRSLQDGIFLTALQTPPLALI
ncbi:hypothetical protein [Anaerovibrio sp. RM50]|nr:hypothetical protein [Anaerovibrio sp. RM50]